MKSLSEELRCLILDCHQLLLEIQDEQGLFLYSLDSKQFSSPLINSLALTPTSYARGQKQLENVTITEPKQKNDQVAHNSQSEKQTDAAGNTSTAPQPSTHRPPPTAKKRDSSISKYSFALQSNQKTNVPRLNFNQDLSTMRAWTQKNLPQFPIIDFTVPFLLILYTNNRAHFHFLQKVAQAITQHIAPAAVIFLGKEEPPPPCKILLMEHPSYTPHTLVDKKIFPLAPIENYLQDTSLKRELWKALLSLPHKSSLSS